MNEWINQSINWFHLQKIKGQKAEIFFIPVLNCMFILNGVWMKLEENGQHFADYYFKCTFLNENYCVLIKISLKVVSKGAIDNKSSWVQRMPWCWTGDGSFITSWWRHQMETFSALVAFCAGNSPFTGEFPTQRPLTQSFDVSVICAWTDSWANNADAGDLRRYRTYYYVIVMWINDDQSFDAM